MHNLEQKSDRHWFECPICGQKICQFTDAALSFELFIKCKKCKNEIEIRVNFKPNEDEKKE